MDSTTTGCAGSNWLMHKAVMAAAVLAAGVGLRAQGIPAASPESQGVSSRAILRWIESCESAPTNDLKGFVHGFVILRHGKVIAGIGVGTVPLK